jgi:alpha-N-arabinofuranosidase
MFKEHQGGTSLPIELTAPAYALGQKKIPMVSASATRAADKAAVHLSLVNTSPSQPVTISARLAGLSPKAVTGRILSAAAIDAHNTFDAPETVKPIAFSGASLESGSLTVTLPAKAVVVLTLK